MPAEIKRTASKVYLLFLAEAVSENEITVTMQSCQRDVDNSTLGTFAMVIDPIRVSNPLSAARWLGQHLPTGAAHIVVVGSDRAGAVLAERIARQCPNTDVQVAPHQQAAVDGAKALLGLGADDVIAACDYLPADAPQTEQS